MSPLHRKFESDGKSDDNVRKEDRNVKDCRTPLSYGFISSSSNEDEERGKRKKRCCFIRWCTWGNKQKKLSNSAQSREEIKEKDQIEEKSDSHDHQLPEERKVEKEEKSDSHDHQLPEERKVEKEEKSDSHDHQFSEEPTKISNFSHTNVNKQTVFDLQQKVTPTSSHHSNRKCHQRQVRQREEGDVKKKGSGNYVGLCFFFCLILAAVVFGKTYYIHNSVYAPPPWKVHRVEVIGVALLCVDACIVLCAVKTRISTVTQFLLVFILVLYNLSLAYMTQYLTHFLGNLKHLEGPWWLVSLVMPLLLLTHIACVGHFYLSQRK